MLTTLPIFPKFEKLSLKHKDDIEYFVRMFPPYNDYLFTSLFTWNISETFCVSKLMGNLVVMFEEYHSDDMFLGVIGNEISKDEVYLLIDKSIELGFGSKLKLIPEHLINDDLIGEFDVKEDLDNHDYILSVESATDFSGKKLRNKRNQYNRFIREYKDVIVRSLDPDEAVIEFGKLLEVCHNKTSDFFEEEKHIIGKCINCDKLPIKVLAVFCGNEIVSLCVYEVLDDYIIIHFEKFNTQYEGVNAFSKTQLAKVAVENNCRYINWEQDLGIESLRVAKKQYCPVNYLKKYSITLKT